MYLRRKTLQCLTCAGYWQDGRISNGNRYNPFSEYNDRVALTEWHLVMNQRKAKLRRNGKNITKQDTIQMYVRKTKRRKGETRNDLDF